jgi:hypothetical protein
MSKVRDKSSSIVYSTQIPPDIDDADFRKLSVSVSVSVLVQTKPKFLYFGFGSNYGFGRSLMQTAGISFLVSISVCSDGFGR